MVTFLKGFIIGIGKIIPGVSGSMLAISLGIYEKCIDIVSNLFYELKYNIKFIFLLCLGVVVSILLGSRIIYYFLDSHYFFTMCLFMGLIGGTVPSILKQTKFKSKKDILYILIPILFVYLISNLGHTKLIIENNIIGYLITFSLGIIDAVTMIVPGVSGTAIFMIIGAYQFILFLFSTITIPFTIFFGFGVIIGVLVTSKVMNYLFKNHRENIYLVILGLSLSSLIYLLIDTFNKNSTVLEFIFGIFLVGIGYFMSNLLDK